jgi:hypothetical protein
MSWTPKEQPSTLDTAEISGLHFLDGDKLARALKVEWTKGQKFPLVEYPSGELCEIWEGRSPNNPIIHLFGEMDLPYQDTRDSAFAKALSIAEQVGYNVSKVGDNQIDLWGYEGRFLVTYDNVAGHIINVEPLHANVGERTTPHQPLLDEESRKRLPALHSQEIIGLAALAIVKFFTPDSNWTWYASEASVMLTDGTYHPIAEIPADDVRIESTIFFGLVSGFELEFGYFTLEELSETHGGLGLPVERDRHFQPKTLEELQQLHLQGRTG